MSIKYLIQILIIMLFLSIIGLVYYEYFNFNKKVVKEINVPSKETQEQFNELEKKINELEKKNKELNVKINESKISLDNDTSINSEVEVTKNSKSENIDDKKTNHQKNQVEAIEISEDKVLEKKKVKNLVKDVEYISVDQKGNKFHLLATSGKSNKNDNNILDLENVRGKITSDVRDTIYIVSDFAQYNSLNLNSKFYQNVIIDYQDKKITCINFDIDMETNKAIAYNNVVVTDPNSIMRAGIVEFDLKTKDIDINPENMSKKIQIITN